MDFLGREVHPLAAAGAAAEGFDLAIFFATCKNFKLTPWRQGQFAGYCSNLACVCPEWQAEICRIPQQERIPGLCATVWCKMCEVAQLSTEPCVAGCLTRAASDLGMGHDARSQVQVVGAWEQSPGYEGQPVVKVFIDELGGKYYPDKSCDTFSCTCGESQWRMDPDSELKFAPPNADDARMGPHKATVRLPITLGSRVTSTAYTGLDKYVRSSVRSNPEILWCIIHHCWKQLPPLTAQILRLYKTHFAPADSPDQPVHTPWGPLAALSSPETDATIFDELLVVVQELKDAVLTVSYWHHRLTPSDTDSFCGPDGILTTLAELYGLPAAALHAIDWCREARSARVLEIAEHQ